MASWVDQPYQFAPYVPQLPVDQMIMVGMEKQRRYDEGVQRIQSSIDRIAGLDIARDVDKRYLQTKMNELDERLKLVAAGDFSNYQLSNHVAGMASSVGKDDNIISAVASTAKYRKEQSLMETARREGKSSIQNEWDFANKSNVWLNDREVGKPFNDTYTQYIDVDKKWFDVLKSLHSDLLEEDIPYIKKADGTIDYNQTAAAMQRISKEKLSTEKIETALRASLSPDELNQLNINGRYHFRGATTANMTEYAKTKYNSQIAQNERTIKELEGLASLSTSSPETRYQATTSISALKRRNKSLETDLSEELKSIIEDPEGAKAQIYRNGAISQFASAHSWEHNKSNILTNPVLEAEHWEKEYALNISKFDWAKFKDRFDMMMSEKEYELKYKKQMEDTYGVNGSSTTYLGQNTKVKSPLVAINNDITDLNKQSNDIIMKMSQATGATKDQIKNAISRYNGGDDEWYKEGSKEIIPVEWRDEINLAIQSQLKAKRLEIARGNVINEVNSSSDYKDRIADILKSVEDLPDITTTFNGRSVVFSPREIVEFMRKRSVSTESGVPRYESDIVAGVSYTEPLTEKEKILARGVDMKNLGIFQRYYNRVGDKIRHTYEDFNDDINKKLLEKSGKYVPTLTSITFSEAEGGIARNKWEDFALNALSRYDKDISGTKGGAETLSQSEINNAREWLSGETKGKVHYKKLTQGEKTFLILIKGSEEILIPLTSHEASTMPLADSGEPSGEYKEIVQTQYMFDGKTNPTGSYEDAYFNRYYLPKVTLDAKADMTWSVSNTGKQFVTLRLKTPIGVLDLKIDDNPMSRDKAIEFIQNLTDDKIKQIYLQSNRVPDEWKEVIKNL